MFKIKLESMIAKVFYIKNGKNMDYWGPHN